MQWLELKAIRKVPFFIWLSLAQAFLLVNASVIAPVGEVERFQTVLIVYMLLTIAFFTLAPRMPLMKATLNQAVGWWVGGLVLGVVVFTSIRELPRFFGSMSLGGPAFLTVFHALVVGVSESWIFLGYLPQILHSPILAQGCFAVFHFASYGGNWLSILVAFVAGLMFYTIMRYTNIWFAASLHSAYNVVVLGVF